MPPLTYAIRYQIEHDIRLGLSNAKIAQALGYTTRTVEREIQRCGCRRTYSADAAQIDRNRCAQNSAANHPTIDPKIWLLVSQGLLKQDSPEQIIHGQALAANPSTIYRHLKRTGQKCLLKHLRHYKASQKRNGGGKKMYWIAEAKSIHDRPKAILTRDTIGHLESDSIVGKAKEADKVIVLIDRPTRFIRLGLARNGTAAEVANLFAGWQADHSGIPMLSVTTDQGYEFGKLPALLPDRVYVCDPGKPYQKGQVEHVNKLIRQYIPKGMSLRGITQAKLDWIAARINARVRKRLGWKSPDQVLSNMTTAPTC
jgi:transposase, IS30 family